MNAAMLRIEARRSVGLWVWPLLAGLALLLESSVGLAWRASYWVQASVLVRDGLLIIGPALGGAAAWMGGRERRRAIGDLLATTPRPVWARRGTTWAAIALWGLLAYGVAGGCVLALAARQTTWGAPVAWPILVGLVAVPAYGAVGYALGALLPHRFTAPLAALALLAVPVLVGYGVGATSGFGVYPSRLDALRYLSPVARLDPSVWYGVRPDVGWPQALFLLGVTGLALGGLTLRDHEGRRERAAWGGVLAGGALSGAAAAILLATAPPSAMLLDAVRQIGGSAPFLARYNRLLAPYNRLIPYTPVCAGAPVPVCVHPAYRARRGAAARGLKPRVEPRPGGPGVPARAEQRPHNEQGVFGRVLAFLPDNGATPTDQFFFGPIVQALVSSYMFDGRGLSNGACPGDPTLQSCFDAQDVIGIWLVRRAGLRLDTVTIGGTTIHPYFGGVDWAAKSAVADRFGTLGRDRQRAWLRAHDDALNKVHIRLRDIP